MSFLLTPPFSGRQLGRETKSIQNAKEFIQTQLENREDGAQKKAVLRVCALKRNSK
jgi:hypothetical protein